MAPGDFSGSYFLGARAALLKKSSPLKLLGQIKPNLAGSIYVISSIKLLHLVPFGQRTWPPRLILFSDWLISCFRGED
jgi:hypothetical protein